MSIIKLIIGFEIGFKIVQYLLTKLDNHWQTTVVSKSVKERHQAKQNIHLQQWKLERQGFSVSVAFNKIYLEAKPYTPKGCRVWSQRCGRVDFNKHDIPFRE